MIIKCNVDSLPFCVLHTWILYYISFGHLFNKIYNIITGKMAKIESRNVSQFHQFKGKYDKTRNMCLPQNCPSNSETFYTPYQHSQRRIGLQCHLTPLKMSSESRMKQLLHCILSRKNIHIIPKIVHGSQTTMFHPVPHHFIHI